MSTEVTVHVNGREMRLAEGASIRHVLERLKVSAPRVAVERNREIVPKAEYGSLPLADGDVLEIVEFVGGG